MTTNHIYTVHSWTKVKKSANSLFRSFGSECADHVAEVYCDSLPRAVKDAIIKCTIYGIPRNDPDFIVVCDAYKQLISERYIGKRKRMRRRAKVVPLVHLKRAAL